MKSVRFGILMKKGKGLKFFKKKNFIITIWYEIPKFLSEGPSFEEGGLGEKLKF